MPVGLAGFSLPVLMDLSRGQVMPFPDQMEIKDKTDDYKIRATVSELYLENVFQNHPDDRYSIGCAYKKEYLCLGGPSVAQVH